MVKRKNSALEAIIYLSRLNNVLTRQFQVHGLALLEFIVLHMLVDSVEGKLRRVDLAGKLGLTASGVTRMLLPMEKVGLIKREKDKNDARVSYAVITQAGKRSLEDAMEKAELVAGEILQNNNAGRLEEML